MLARAGAAGPKSTPLQEDELAWPAGRVSWSAGPGSPGGRCLCPSWPPVAPSRRAARDPLAECPVPTQQGVGTLALIQGHSHKTP